MKPIDRLRALLALPMPETRDDIGSFPNEGGDLPICFDPWELFPSLYGSYSSEFDDMAIMVLENIQKQDNDGETLAHEMFREMLCSADLCDYGTSPRTCFPYCVTGFDKLLPELISKWKTYRVLKWGY